MPSFRGIEVGNVISSIENAVRFLEAQNLGPETAKTLAPWLDGTKTDILKAAKDDKALVQAMAETGAMSDFLFLSDAYIYHGYNNTDGQGEQIARELSHWGAFSGARHLAYTRMDGEIQCHVLSNYARDLHTNMNAFNRVAMGTKVATIGKLMQMDAGELKDVKKAISGALELMKRGQDDKLPELFTQYDLRTRHNLEDMMRVLVLGRKAMGPAPFLEGPMGRYGIVETQLNNQQVIEPMMEKLGEILTPFAELDETGMTGLGCITEDMKTIGVMFDGTKRVAQAVADAFPDKTVMDFKGKVILPQNARAPQQKPNKSGPGM